MLHVALVFLGGGLGAVGRHLVGQASLRLIGPGFPWGTLAVNIVGSLAMGLLAGFLALKVSATQEVRLLLATGFLGGFTTFSAFSLDFALLVERKAFGLAGAYAAGSVLLSLGAVFLGLYLIRSIAQ